MRRIFLAIGALAGMAFSVSAEDAVVTHPATQIVKKTKPCGDESAKYPVHLTFDDGPNPDTTLTILDKLDRYKPKIRATFFISSWRLSDLLGDKPLSVEEEKTLALVREIVKRGHQLGSHSFQHIERAAPSKVSETQALENLDKNDQVWEKLAKIDALKAVKRPVPFRFPYGSGWFQARDAKSDAQAQADKVMKSIKNRGFYPVHWDIDSWDWSAIKNKMLPESALDQICTHKGGIMLMHDVQKFTAANVDIVIDSILGSGHRFVSLEEIKKENSKKAAGEKFVSLADAAASSWITCGGRIGELDQVWPSCADYDHHIGGASANGSAK